MNTRITSLFLMVAIMLFQSSAQASLQAANLSLNQLKAVKQFIATDVKADLEATWPEQLQEVSQSAGGGDPTWGGLLMGDPMSEQTQDQLAKGVYLLIASSLAEKGVYLSEANFRKKIKSVLEISSRMGVFPSAITAGYMSRLQAGVGGSAGSQFNIYFDKGELKASEYSIYGGHLGFAEMTKVQFYVSFCFGTCFGGDASGWYLGLDGTGAAVMGADLFIEGGVDITDLMKASRAGTKYSIRDLYKSKAIYIGFGFDLGQGAGISGDVFYYTHDFDMSLLKANQTFTPKAIGGLKF
jgi:hypothetical protein